MPPKNFRELTAWQRAMSFVSECYRLTKSFPSDEKFGLTSQLRRAAVSVPSNIAEGHGRGHLKSSINHLWIANGSLREAETQLLIAEQLGYVRDAELQPCLALADEVGRLLTGLRRSLVNRLRPTGEPPEDRD